MSDDTIKLTIDKDTISRYEKYYFSIHTKAHKSPIDHPYHESMNTWMRMRRAMMNALKQKWKDFIVWLIEESGYSDIKIDKCKVRQVIYYPTSRRHDPDNTSPKFILDGLVEGGMIVDDDSTHIVSLILECGVDKEYPHTDIYITKL